MSSHETAGRRHTVVMVTEPTGPLITATKFNVMATVAKVLSG